MQIKTPLKAIRAKCFDCMNNSTKEITLCPSTDCSLYPYRLGHRPKEEADRENIKTPIKAIRAKCLNCSCFCKEEVKNCTFTDCALYQYRLGRRPKKSDNSTAN